MIELDWVYLVLAAMAWVVTLAGAAAWAYDRGYNNAIDSCKYEEELHDY